MLEKIIYSYTPSLFDGNEFEKFMLWCVKQKASDITIQNDEQIVCHIYGKKYKVTNRRLRKSELINIITHIYKGDGAVSILNSAKPVDMAWVIRENREKSYRFRINMISIDISQDKGYSLTIRVINNDIPSLNSLNLPKEILENIDPLQGMFLVTGPVGSGKSTLLAAIIAARLKDPNSHIKVSTFESPIEFTYDDIPKPSSIISQSEINVHVESYKEGLRNSLRMATDVILLGELRDKESIEIGITAAMTGSLLYSTLHTKGVAATIKRMVNEFTPEERNTQINNILSSIRVIISQLLIPSLDGKRIAIREYLIFNQEIIDSLANVNLDNLTYEINQQVIKNGKTFIQDLNEKYKENLISEATYQKMLKNFA